MVHLITSHSGGSIVRSDDWGSFGSYSFSANRQPKCVVRVLYDDETLNFTSHSGLSNLSGTTLEEVLSGVSSTSQKVFPMDGRTQIGGVTVRLLDNSSPSTFTDKVRSQLASVDSPPDAGESLRHKEVQVWVGYTDDFSDFVQVVTTYVNEVSLNKGEYTLACIDVTRQMRKSIFEQKKTRLAANLSDPDTSPQSDISVTTVDGFAMLEHTGAFTDAPSQTVGYLRVVDTGEIIRYTGISESPLAFTGITREVFGTVGGAVTVDIAEAEDQWPELEEFVYLEMPAPQLAYAVITGEVLGSSPTITLPEHWHMGIDTAQVEASEFSDIGDDLYYDDESGVILRFEHLKKTDGKKFVESEIHRLVGTYSPVNRDGKLGLRRINQVLSDASPVISLNEAHVVNHSALKHKQSDVVNQFRIDYQPNAERYLRSLSLTDADSISRNNTVKEKVLKFKGLHNARHTQSVIYSLINGLQVRYRNAPEELSIDVMPYLDVLEAGDVIKLTLDHLQDFSSDGTLSRAFEIQSVRIDWMKGKVTLGLFGSSGEEGDPLLTPPAPVLADAFYTSKGTDLASISPSIVDGSGHITADCTLTGDADMTDAGAVYYYDGDLTIDNGVTVTITDNVQLRVKGTLTVNGEVNGVGGGITGSTSHFVSEKLRIRGYVGDTRGTDGWHRGESGGTQYKFNVGQLGEGYNSSFPSLSLNAGDQTASPIPTDISGIPTDLRGTGGGKGGSCLNHSNYAVSGDKPKGGDGGDGGAGLCVIARAFNFGASGQIDLSGTDGDDPGTYFHFDQHYFRAGTGGGGGAGCVLALIDGANALPDLSGGNFIANTGLSEPVTGMFQDNEGHGVGSSWNEYYNNSPSNPLLGHNDGYPSNPVYIISGVDRSATNRKAMHIPESA